MGGRLSVPTDSWQSQASLMSKLNRLDHPGSTRKRLPSAHFRPRSEYVRSNASSSCKVKIRGGNEQSKPASRTRKKQQRGNNSQQPKEGRRMKEKGEGASGRRQRAPSRIRLFEKRRGSPDKRRKNRSNSENRVGFHRVPVQGVTSSEGTLIRRYLGSLCSLLPALLLKPCPLPTMRPGVQIGPTASQGQHTVRRARFPFVRARRPADVNRQGMALHLAL